MVTVPSAFWWFSNTAMSVRPTARPEPFRAWTKSAYVEASPLRAPPIGGWRSLRFVAAPPPHAGGGAHERPPKIPPRACRRRSCGAVYCVSSDGGPSRPGARDWIERCTDRRLFG